MAYKDPQVKHRYERRYRYAVAHGLPHARDSHPGTPRDVIWSAIWDLPADAEQPTHIYTLPASGISGPALACCDAWWPIVALPVICEQCGRRYFEREEGQV